MTLSRIFIGSDHAGFELKVFLANTLQAAGHVVEDFGCFSSKERCDYPDIAETVCTALLEWFDCVEEEEGVGILCCGTGVGISIAANKIKGIRCALCSDTHTAAMARKHNNANVLALGARSPNGKESSGSVKANEIMSAFLGTSFEDANNSGGRHAVRIAKIHALEHKPKLI